MVRRTEPEPAEHDEQLGEAIEAYLELVEAGNAPDPEAFAARYPDLGDDLAAALEGLALVRGLVGEPGAQGPGGRLETGHRVAGYRIVRELGRGGMGVVYEAVHVGLDRPVALKVLGTQAAPDSNGRRRFLNEARTAAELHHTHIVPVFDVGQVGGLYYYAMQRIEGSGLDRVVRHLRRDRPTAAGSTHPGATPRKTLAGLWTPRPTSAPKTTAARRRGSDSETGPWGDGAEPAAASGLLSGSAALSGSRAGLGSRFDRDRDDGPPPFEPPRGSAYYRWVAQVGRQAAEALAHAHRRGVIHRDVKPSNLLVDGRGLIWVADFGLARRLADPGLTQHDSLLGTPRYMSPEQARVGPIDGRSDLFSLGATLYELLTLRPPFEGRSAAELVVQIRDREPARPRQADPKVPRDLETIVLKLLSKRPADRYESADALADDLGRFLNREPVRARRISPAGRLWRFAQRHPGVTAVSTVAAATVITVSTVAYVRVVHARDQAVEARDQAVKARDQAERTGNELQAAYRTNLSNGAKLLLRSGEPDRRAAGLAMIKKAAALKPDARLRSTLRDDAVDFLVLREVRALPGFATGKARGLAFGPDGSRLAVLSNDGGGESVGIWSVARRELDRTTRNDAPGRGAPAGAPPGGPRGSFGPSVASAGQCAAVVAPFGRAVRLIDSVTGAWVRELEAPPDHAIVSVAAAPEGQRLVTVALVGRGGRDRDPNRRDPSAGPGARPPGPSKAVVHLWDPRDADRPPLTLKEFEPDPANPRRPVSPMTAISPDGQTVAVALPLSTSVSVFDGETGQPVGPPIETQVELTALALGAGGQLAAAGGGEIRLWDVESRVPLTPLTTNYSAVRFLRFGPRGSLLAVGGWGPGVELHDAATHALVATLPTAEPVEDVAFAPEGRTLAAVGPKETPVWDVVEPDVRERIAGLDTTTRSMDFRGDGLLALGGGNGPIRFWSPGVDAQSVDARARPGSGSGSGSSPGSAAPSPRDPAASLAFDDRGRLIVVEPDALIVREAPPRCRELQRVALPGAPWGTSLPLLASSPDGRTLAVGRVTQAEPGRGGSGPGAGPRGPLSVLQVLLWRSDAPERLVEVVPPPGVNLSARRNGRGTNWASLAVSPAGDRLYLLDDQGGLHAWSVDGPAAADLAWPDAPQPEGPPGSEPAHAKAMKLALSPDGRALAAGDSRGVVTLFDTATGQARGRLATDRPEQGRVWSLAFGPDGKDLAVGTHQGDVVVWSLAAPGVPVFRLPSRGPVFSLAFEGRGRYLALAGIDRVVDVWDLTRLRNEFARRGLAW